MPEERDEDVAAIESVVTDTTDAAPTEVTLNTRLRFVLTVEGDGESGNIKVEAWKYAKDGTLIEAAPVKEREADNIVVGLYDGGIFFQTASLLMGRTMALASGDLLRAVQIDVMADQLGITLPAIADDELTEKPTAQWSIFTDAISKALAG